MTSAARKSKWLVACGLVLALGAVGALLGALKLSEARGPLPVMGQLPDFKLTNQDNQVISLADLRGKVWIADVIYTRCPGPCRTMTGKVEDLQSAFSENDGVRFVTLTSDPLYDSPKVLKKFAGEFQADPKRWWFLTGKPSEIHGLEVNDFKFAVVENQPADRSVPDDWFTHSTWFALVDRDGKLRGWVDRDGRQRAIFESDDAAAMARLKSAIKQLLREPVT